MLVKKLLGKLHRVSLRGKILIAFVVIMTLFLYRVSFSTKYYIVEKHGQEQVGTILQGAHNYFYDKLENMTYLFRTITTEMELRDYTPAQMAKVKNKVQAWPSEIRPDILFFTDKEGKVIYSKNNPEPVKDIYQLDILKLATMRGETSGIEVLDKQLLEAEGVAGNACINIVPTPQATNLNYTKECKAMAMMVVEPVHKNMGIAGYVVLGKILNNNNTIVDNIKKNFGARSTIFLDRVRIATNVTNDQGDRATGTLLSDPVYDKVIKKGSKYTGRAFVVNNWYVTAYEPIKDVNGKVVGALYVGTEEKPLLEMQQSVNNQIRVTLAVAVVVFAIAILWVYRSVVKPIHNISTGVLHIARGDFGTRFPTSQPNRCWEIMDCQQEECPAYNNALIRCWLLSDAWCRHQGNNCGKPDCCLHCDVYNIYSGNELDRLIDAVNFMAMFIDERTKAMEELNKQLEANNKELAEHRDELESQKENLLQLNRQLEESMKALDHSQNIIYALAVAVEAKDPYTRGHSERVAEYSIRLAKRLGINGDDLELLKGAALLHDIGKIGISGSILRKPGALNALEFQQVRKHPSIGERICLSLKFAQEMLPIIRHHHEHYNGQGYPDGLKGEHIPLMARIIAIADAYDAMTSDRPYRSGMPREEALRRLREGAGTQWDPKLVPEFINLVQNEFVEEVAVSKENGQFLR
ncbi:cache domain-containing protein [Thermincola potens]|uniref:Metal dependent phosphohydrolase n=1 Tax=Thermincola potens (strain JR) TaxID=635013 RepID=D5XCJ0_THEPJ|nr:HD domain-containing phosphohydrolase [Thermincola potens]ADG81616.1 metal dependent phosphohydrolase [Thermincola potens JR]